MYVCKIAFHQFPKFAMLLYLFLNNCVWPPKIIIFLKVFIRLNITIVCLLNEAPCLKVAGSFFILQNPGKGEYVLLLFFLFHL